MSRRARSARRLASILTEGLGVHVTVEFHRRTGLYGVHWTGEESTTAVIRRLVTELDPAEIPELNVSALVLLRTVPQHHRAR